MLAAWPFLGMLLFCFIISDSHGFFCFPEMAHTRFSKNSCANGANRLTKRPRQNLQLCVGPALIFQIEKWEKKTKLTWIRIFFPSCELSYGRRKCPAPKMDDAWLASDIGQPGPLHSSNSSQLGRDFNLTTVHPLFSNRYTDFVAVSIFKFIEMTLSPARCGVKSSLFQVWSCRRSPQRRLSKDSSLAYVLSNWWTLSANQSQKLCRTYSSEPATACSVAFIYLIQFHVCTSLARLPFPGSVSISDIGGISDKEAASSPQDLCCQAPSPLPPYFPILPLPLPGFDGKWKSAILPGNVTNCRIAVKFIVLHKVPHWRVLGIMWQQNQYTSCSGHCVHRGQQMLLCTSNHLAL